MMHKQLTRYVEEKPPEIVERTKIVLMYHGNGISDKRNVHPDQKERQLQFLKRINDDIKPRVFDILLWGSGNGKEWFDGNNTEATKEEIEELRRDFDEMANDFTSWWTQHNNKLFEPSNYFATLKRRNDDQQHFDGAGWTLQKMHAAGVMIDEVYASLQQINVVLWNHNKRRKTINLDALVDYRESANGLKRKESWQTYRQAIQAESGSDFAPV